MPRIKNHVDPASSNLSSHKGDRKDENAEGNSSLCLINPLSKSSHSTDVCKQFIKISIPDRFRLVKDSRTCFLCLEKGHIRTTCKSQSKYKTCREHSHHVLLCRKEKISPLPSSNQNPVGSNAR